MNKSVVIIVAVVLLAIVGGGGLLLASKSDSTSTPNTTSSSTKSTDPGPAAAGGVANKNNTTKSSAVAIENFAFSPTTITVKKGTTITWTNKDSAAHTVTETDGQTGPNSGNLDQGKTYSFTYNTVGTFKYHCALHASMTGTVVVTE